MRFRNDSPEPGGYSTAKAAGRTKPRLPDVMSESTISFDPSLPPATFPSKLHVSPGDLVSSRAELTVTCQAGSNMADGEVTITKDDKKRKRDREDLNSTAAVEEVQQGDFAVVIDWTASNSHQNPIWKANMTEMTDNKPLSCYEGASESYEHVLTRNELIIDSATDEDEVRSHHKKNFGEFGVADTVNRKPT